MLPISYCFDKSSENEKAVIPEGWQLFRVLPSGSLFAKGKTDGHPYCIAQWIAGKSAARWSQVGDVEVGDVVTQARANGQVLLSARGPGLVIISCPQEQTFVEAVFGACRILEGFEPAAFVTSSGDCCGCAAAEDYLDSAG